MKCMQHVLWRGALALGLMMVGIGSGVGLPAVSDGGARASACRAQAEPALAIAPGARTAKRTLRVSA
jgi:hypothetical protein